MIWTPQKLSSRWSSTTTPGAPKVGCFQIIKKLKIHYIHLIHFTLPIHGRQIMKDTECFQTISTTRQESGILESYHSRIESNIFQAKSDRKKTQKVTMKIHSKYLNRIASLCKPSSHQLISMQQIPWRYHGLLSVLHPRLWQQNLSLLRSFCKSVGEAQCQQTHLRRHGLWRKTHTDPNRTLNRFEYQGKVVIRLHCSRKGW